MSKDKERDQAEEEFLQLQSALEHKVVRDILWREVIEPSGCLKAYISNDPIANARFLAKGSLGNALMENIKAANLEAWFHMIKDNQFEEDVELADSEELKATEGSA